MYKKYIIAQSDLLLNISLVGGQSLKWINHERDGQMIYQLSTDQKTVIIKATNYCQCEFISILIHKKIKNMNESFIVNNGSAILNKPLQFSATLV